VILAHFTPSPPAEALIAEQVRLALREDVGSGDRTAGLLPAKVHARARILCREQAVLCGVLWVEEIFRQLDPSVGLRWAVGDGDALSPGQIVCELQGPAPALLTGERTALNYLQTLSGTATRARRYAQAVAGTGVTVLDTRKTLPGLRVQQKYAVVCGGCANHRMGLYDAVLIKENHITAAGSIAGALQAARRLAPDLEVEIEVEDLAQLDQALAAGAKRVLLDNFGLKDLRQAVALNRGRARLEASGGVSLDTIRAIAETGVDDISVGGLTKDMHAVDLSMRFD
jgi:nicotinate-nucleotide pyrophosphorylase (carboxylating)